MNRDRLGRRSRGAAGTDKVARITSAAVPLTDDVAQRTRRYLIQMSIRVVCFVAAVAIDHWTRWVLLVGAVVLPYIAVVLANAGHDRSSSDPGTFLPPAVPRALPSAGPVPDPGPPRPGR